MTEVVVDMVLVTPRFPAPLEHLKRRMYSRAKPREKTKSTMGKSEDIQKHHLLFASSLQLSLYL